MNILTFLLIGFISGWTSSRLVEGHGLGVIGDIVVGIIGAFVGGYAFSLMGISTFGFWGSVVMSVVGAVIFLLIVRTFMHPKGFHKSIEK